MLVLSRKPGEKLRIGHEITLTVVEITGNRVRLGIDAPPHIEIYREELIAHDVTVDREPARVAK